MTDPGTRAHTVRLVCCGDLWYDGRTARVRRHHSLPVLLDAAGGQRCCPYMCQWEGGAAYLIQMEQ